MVQANKQAGKPQGSKPAPSPAALARPAHGSPAPTIARALSPLCVLWRQPGSTLFSGSREARFFRRMTR